MIWLWFVDTKLKPLLQVPYLFFIGWWWPVLRYDYQMWVWTRAQKMREAMGHDKDYNSKPEKQPFGIVQMLGFCMHMFAFMFCLLWLFAVAMKK